MDPVVINHNLGKKDACTLVKKCISGKMAVVKDSDGYLKLGTPPFMTFEVNVTDTTIEVKSKGLGDPLAQTCVTEVEMALEERNSSSSPSSAPTSSAPSSGTTKRDDLIGPDEYLEYQKKTIELLKQYKELLDNDIISQQEFNEKKEDLLNFISGMTQK